MNPDYIARCAALAMLLEVSASPKPGNVDRDHDFADTRYEHFLASAISIYPVIREAGESQEVGKMIRECAERSARSHKGGNTHFGTFILLVPLAMAAHSGDMQDRARHIAANTTVEDAVNLYKAFQSTKVHVKPVSDLDVYDENSIRMIRERKLTLYDVMRIASEYDVIAREFTSGFERSFEYASCIYMLNEGHINDVIVGAYMRMLAEHPDTFIVAKFGESKAKEISLMASHMDISELDERLIRENINPGSTADIITAALFIALLRGLQF